MISQLNIMLMLAANVQLNTYLSRKYPKIKILKNLHKVYVPAANGSLDLVLGQPMYGPPNSVCSQTFLVIGYDPTKHHLTKK